MQTVILGVEQSEYLAAYLVAIARNKPIEVSSTCILVVPVVRYKINNEFHVVANTRLKLPYLVQCDYSVSIYGFKWVDMETAIERIDGNLKEHGRIMILKDTQIYRDRSYFKLSGQFMAY